MKRILPYLHAFPALMCRMVLACLLPVVVAACVRDRMDAELPPVPAQAEQVEVKLHLRTSQPSSPTRAMTPEQENLINDVYVFFLNTSGGTVYSVVKGESVAPDGGGDPAKWTFTASLTVTTGSSGSFDCLVLANAAGWMEGKDLTQFNGKSYDELQEMLVSDVLAPAASPGSPAGLPGATSEAGIMMWGKAVDPITVPAPTASITVPVIRALASVEVGVGVGPTLANVNSWTGWDGNDASGSPILFELKTVYVFLPNNKYAFMPRWDAYVPDDRKVNAPSPAGASLEIGTPFAYPVTGYGIRGQIYLPEADIKQLVPGGDGHTGKPGDAGHTNRCALVVGGKYNGNTESYYRIDFNDNAADRRLIDLLRNHRYYVTITAVYNDGEDTPQKAYESQKVNLGIEITGWDENFQDVSFDGANWMYAAKKSITLPGNEQQTGTIAMESSIDPTEWEMSFLSGSDGGSTLPSKDPSVQNTYFKVTKPTVKEGGSLKITTLTAMAETDPDRVARLSIKAHGLSFTITITQKADKPADWEEEGGNFDKDY